MKHKSLLLAAALLGLVACSHEPSDSFDALNRAAAKEYLTPIRPFTEGRNACWNTYSKKFIYAPVFDFPEVEGAVSYRFTLTPDIAVTETAVRGDDDSSESAAAGKEQEVRESTDSYTFIADKPSSPLTPVWADVPVGKVVLKVEGLDKSGKVVGLSGERRFLRDFPFEGPYTGNIRPYREAALMAMLYIHSMPQVKHWKESTEPDMTYKHNTYPNKIIGNTVSVESALGRYFPEYAEEAIAIAKGAAQFLIDQSRPEGDRLAYFPPSYYGGLIASKKDWNIGKIMTMDPCYAANGFLDLYDATGEDVYYKQALHIADTYAKIQNEDGSYPIKCFFETGEPVNEAKAMLHPVLNFFRRLETQYGVTAYVPAREKAAKWMKEVALETFDLTGQFEDVNVEDVKPFQNLTNCTASPYASYLLKGQPSKQDIEDARDLIRMSEDQFVHWNSLPEKNGIRRLFGPCVFEQHRYQTPVDNSSCNVANAYLDLYEATGDKLAFAKAKALVDALTIAQQVTNGYTPTTIDYRNPEKDKGRTFWLNCGVATIKIWLRMAELTGE